MLTTKLNSNNSKPPSNGGYGSKILAPVMDKPPPNTNTFPVKVIAPMKQSNGSSKTRV
jgi:hypothetical protein